MAGRKRSLELGSSSSSSSDTPSAKRLVQSRTVQKWIADNEKTLNTTLWLKFEKSGREHVSKLSCSICKQFQEKLQSMRNYRPAFIEGTTNVKSSTFKEHAGTDMHKRAMMLFKKQHSSHVTDYAPIAQLFAHSKMDKVTVQQMKRKFDIAYLIVKENLAFSKMKPLCDLEERHNTDLGGSYKNDHGCSTFVRFIALEQQEKLLTELSSCRFFSVQVDGSTDAANIEEELFLTLYLDTKSQDGAIHVRNRFFCVRQCRNATGKGLFETLVRAMEYVGVKDWTLKLIGLGCDGCSANMGGNSGLKAHLKEAVPWAVVSWCLAHRLELSLKDALNSTFFATIDDLLLQLYLMYNKSPKKCAQLEDIVAELKSCLEPDDIPTQGGDRPLRASGTRFVAHKVSALGRLVDRHGAYLSHLAALIQDPQVKGIDKAKLSGYVKKWQNFRVLLGCALFYEILKPASILCETLQRDELCVVRAIESIMKTKKSLDTLKATTFEDLPAVKKVLSRVKTEDVSETKTYQGADVKEYVQGLQFIKGHYVEWIEAVESCLKARIKMDDTELLTHAVTLLATNGWQRSEDAAFGHVALDAVCAKFLVPLETSNVDCSLVREEWNDMVEYACQYLNIVTEDYKAIWWKLFNAVDSHKWTNVLAVIELLFCLPVANGHLERVFSQLKLIKSSRRTCIGEDTLDYLIRVNVEGPPLSQWDASVALELWSKEKARRVNQKESKAHQSQSGVSQEETLSSETSESLQQVWEDWIADTTADTTLTDGYEAEPPSDSD